MATEGKNEEIIFNIARKLKGAEREAYLKQICTDDSVMRQRIDALLKAHEDQGAFLQPPVGEVAAAMQKDPALASDQEAPAHSTPDGSYETDVVDADNEAHTVSDNQSTSDRSDYGNYWVVKSLAKGGMGQVSLAEDRSFNRTVVLKEILEPLAQSARNRRRFVNEAQITGQLEHPGIVPVYALGVDRRGRPFYTMRRVLGDTLETAIAKYHAESSPSGLRELLRRFIAVCQTLAYAHAQGVVHRDLKPSNVMAGEFGETLVLDWGLAKPIAQGNWLQPTRAYQPHEELFQPSMATQPGAKVGTPPYMAPEQAEGRTEETPAADIYGLGSVLYQLLVNKPPYTGRSRDEILEKVHSTAPEKPSEVQPDVPRPLEAICLKAMAREPEDRYRGAAALGADVQHWLDDEPVDAYPEPWLGRVWRWIRHHKATTAGTLVFMFTAVLAAAVAGPLIVKHRAQVRMARQTAEEYRRQSDAAIALADQKEEQAKQADKQRDQAQAQSVKHLEAAMAANREAQAARARVQQLEADLQASKEHAQKVEKLQHELDQARQQLAALEKRVAEETQRARIARDKADQMQQEAARLRAEARRLGELSGELSHLASGKQAKVDAVRSQPSAMADLTEGNMGKFDIYASDASFSALAPDRSRVRVGHSSLRIDSLSQDSVRIGYPSNRAANWDLTVQEYVNLALFSPSRADGELESIWVRMGRGSSYVEYQSDAWAVSRAKDRWLHTSIPLSGNRHWKRVDTNEPNLSHVDWIEVHAKTTGSGLTYYLDDLGFAKEPILSRIVGAIPLSAKLPGVARWQVDTIAPRHRLLSVDWSPDGKLIACGSAIGRVRIYDARTLELVRLFVGHTDMIGAMAWSPDGQWLASASQDRTIRLWNADGTPGPVIRDPNSLYRSVAWSPDGRHLVSGNHYGTVNVWGADGTPGPVLKGHPKHATSVAAWSPDGLHIASGSGDGIRLWDSDGTPGALLEGHNGRVNSVAWSPDGRLLASGGADTTVRIWSSDGTPGPVLEGHTAGIYQVAWNADGTQLASLGGQGEGTIRLWTAAGDPGPVLKNANYAKMAWSPDGKQLVAAGESKIQLFKADGAIGPNLARHKADVWSVSWSPDGKRLASASWDGTVRMWGPDGKPEGIFEKTRGYVFSMAWSPDGEQLASGHRFAVHVLEADGTRGPVLKGDRTDHYSAKWSRDGRRLAAGTQETARVRLWESDGTPGPILEGHTSPVTSVAWRPDGTMLASVSEDRTVRLWQADGKPGPVLEGHDGSAPSLDWSPDGQWVASGGRIKVCFWRPDGTPGMVLPGHTPLAWSPDGQWLATGYQNVFRLWHADGTPGPVLQGSDVGPTSLAWTRDGRHLTLGCQANTILQWEVETAEPEWVALLLNDGKSVTFGPTGEVIYGEPKTIDEELVYLIQREAGKPMELLKSVEFRMLSGAPDRDSSNKKR